VIAALPEIDRAVASTDHDEIARVAEGAGIAVPFRRPPELSGDRIADQPVLEHALLAAEEKDGLRYDVVLMLQPTSPLRTPSQVRRCLETLVDGDWDAVWTVSETDSKNHPLKQLVMDEQGRMEYYDGAGAEIIARQQLRPVYHRNGIAYAVTRECLVGQRTLKGEKTCALVIPGMHISIDTEFDLAFAQFVLDQGAESP